MTNIGTYPDFVTAQNDPSNPDTFVVYTSNRRIHEVLADCFNSASDTDETHALKQRILDRLGEYNG